MNKHRAAADATRTGSRTGQNGGSPLLDGRDSLPTLTDRQRAWCRFAYGCAALVMVWGGVLPFLGELPPVRSHVERLEQAQINTGAMFYTELRESEREWNWLRDQ